MADRYPVEMRHSKVAGTTWAASPSSEAVLRANGWKRKTGRNRTETSPSELESEPE